MYYFKKTEKTKVLQGRTITYLAEEKLHVSITYLSLVLSGKKGCSIRLAESISKCISPSTTIEDCFIRKGK